LANLFDDANAPETEPATIVAAISVGESAEVVGKYLVDYADMKQANAKKRAVSAADISER
jgi:hypothetical protein